jgi:hypothetical protein
MRKVITSFIFLIAFSLAITPSALAFGGGAFSNGAVGTVDITNSSTDNNISAGREYLRISISADMNVTIPDGVSQVTVGIYPSGTTSQAYAEKIVSATNGKIILTDTFFSPGSDIDAEEYYEAFPTSDMPGNTVELVIKKGTGSNTIVYYKSATFKLFDYSPATLKPILKEVIAIEKTSDATPDYTFKSTKAGTISYAGSCASTTTTATANVNNTITFQTLNPLPPRSYTNCTIKVTDANGNVSLPLAVSPFTIVVAAPVLTEVIPVPTPTTSTAPYYTFKSSEAGSISYGGACFSSTTTVFANSNTTITFKTRNNTPLPPGDYVDCVIRVKGAITDAYSVPLIVKKFTVILAGPLIAEKIRVPTPTSDATPEYTFTSTKAGTIIYDVSAKNQVSCNSNFSDAVVGDNKITFNALPVGGPYSCKITVRDSAGVLSNVLSVSPYTISAPAGTSGNTNSGGTANSAGGGVGGFVGGFVGGATATGSGGTSSYTTGKGLVPLCNKGPLTKYEVGKDQNNNPIMDYKLGEVRCDFTQLILLINTIINFLLFYIASPIAAVIFCYAGLKMIFDGGSGESRTAAKKMIGFMIKGYLIALLAWLIVHTIIKVFDVNTDPTTGINTFLEE